MPLERVKRKVMKQQWPEISPVPRDAWCGLLPEDFKMGQHQAEVVPGHVIFFNFFIIPLEEKELNIPFEFR